MASYNSERKKLMAIYSLQFYKRKNNWKLTAGADWNEDKFTKPLLSQTTIKLNKTYSVDEEISQFDGAAPHHDEEIPQFDGAAPHQTVESPHNKAFLNEEPEDAPDLQAPDDAPSSPAPEYGTLRPHSWSGQLYNSDRSEPLWQDAQQDWCEAEPEVILEELPDMLAYDQCDEAWHQHKLWAPAPDLSPRPAVDPLDCAIKSLTSKEMLSEAEDWLLRHGYPLLQREYACSYDGHELTDESEDFVRGAHEAPHSSEIELNITQECPCTGQNNLSALTGRQLARAIQRHHFMLARLLWERAIRDGLSASTGPHPFPFEECPTRDTDPLRAPDGVLAGSHHFICGPFSAQPLQATGRGRGRLQQARQLVGVAMGRPYLL